MDFKAIIAANIVALNPISASQAANYYDNSTRSTRKGA
jgi:hypothetical protein